MCFQCTSCMPLTLGCQSLRFRAGIGVGCFRKGTLNRSKSSSATCYRVYVYTADVGYHVHSLPTLGKWGKRDEIWVSVWVCDAPFLSCLHYLDCKSQPKTLPLPAAKDPNPETQTRPCLRKKVMVEGTTMLDIPNIVEQVFKVTLVSRLYS